jgi:hypothetical protein
VLIIVDVLMAYLRGKVDTPVPRKPTTDAAHSASSTRSPTVPDALPTVPAADRPAIGHARGMRVHAGQRRGPTSRRRPTPLQPRDTPQEGNFMRAKCEGVPPGRLPVGRGIRGTRGRLRRVRNARMRAAPGPATELHLPRRSRVPPPARRPAGLRYWRDCYSRPAARCWSSRADRSPTPALIRRGRAIVKTCGSSLVRPRSRLAA